MTAVASLCVSVSLLALGMVYTLSLGIVVYLSIQGCMCMRETRELYLSVCCLYVQTCSGSRSTVTKTSATICKQQFRFRSLLLFFEAVVAGSGYIYLQFIAKLTNFRKKTILVYQYHNSD